MRFSLKWLLAGTVYVAIAAAAFARPHWAYVQLLRGVTFFAIVYALIVAIFGRGHRQVAAAGFVIATSLLLLYAHVYPVSMPTPRVYDALVTPSAITTPGGETKLNQRVDVFEAVGTMAAGLVGAVLGAVAYRRGRVEREGE